MSEVVQRVSVVIPNFNGREHLPECLEALSRQSYRDFEILVVDNGSTDASLEWLRVHVPDVRVIARVDNGGFSVAVNEGILASRAEFVALLNNDTAVDADWLKALVDALDETGYDIAASLMVFYETPETVNTAGDGYDMAYLVGTQRGRGGAVSEYRDSARILGACAGAALYRRALFDDIGLFDSDFFLVHEDTDINLRALVAGRKCVYAPGSVVRHKDSATIRKQPSPLMARLLVRNQYVVIGKDMPTVLLPVVAAIFAWRTFRGVFPLRPSMWGTIPGNWRKMRQTIPIQAEGFRMGWGKRAEVWRLQAVSTHEIIRWLFKGAGPV